MVGFKHTPIFFDISAEKTRFDALLELERKANPKLPEDSFYIYHQRVWETLAKEPQPPISYPEAPHGNPLPFLVKFGYLSCVDCGLGGATVVGRVVSNLVLQDGGFLVKEAVGNGDNPPENVEGVAASQQEQNSEQFT